MSDSDFQLISSLQTEAAGNSRIASWLPCRCCHFWQLQVWPQNDVFSGMSGYHQDDTINKTVVFYRFWTFHLLTYLGCKVITNFPKDVCYHAHHCCDAITRNSAKRGHRKCLAFYRHTLTGPSTASSCDINSIVILWNKEITSTTHSTLFATYKY